MGPTGYIIGGLGLLLAVSCGGNYLLFKSNQGLVADVATERANVQTAKDEALSLSKDVQRLTDLRAADQRNMDLLTDKAKAAQRAADAAVAELNKWRASLEGEMFKNPEAVARAAGLAFRRVLRDIEQASGGQSAGATNEDVPPGKTGTNNSPGN